MKVSLERGPLLPTLLLVPTAVLLGGLLAFPLLLGILLGFKDATIGDVGSFIGLENYRYLLTDPVFRITALNTALYTLVTVVFKLALGLALALILNQKFAGYRFWRSVLLLPYVVPTVLSAFAWWWILDPQFSFVSWALVKLGILDQRVNFLGDAWLARGSLMVANVWRGIPFFTVGYLAGLQAIPRELHEAAAIDGAGDWQIFWQITWVLLLPLTTILTIFSAIFTFTDFQLIWTITRGGPANATHLFVTLAYQRAIPGGALGEGAAIAGFGFRGAESVSLGIYLAYLIPPAILFIPLAEVMLKLGWFDRLWALVPVYSTFLVPFRTWLLVGYLKTIPRELEEAAMVDGASRLRVLFHIIVPLSAPGLISAFIFSF